MRQSCVSYTEKLLFSNARRNKLFWLSRLYYLEESLSANRNKSSSRTKLQIFLQLNFMKRFPFAYFKNFLPAFLLLQLNITSQIPSSLKTQENINKVSILCMFIWRLKLLLSLCRNNAVDFYFTNACRKWKGIHSLMQLEIFLSRLLEFCSRLSYLERNEEVVCCGYGILKICLEEAHLVGHFQVTGSRKKTNILDVISK